MNEQARKLKNQALKEWRRKNPDKVKAASIRYWEKKAREMEEKSNERKHE